MSSDEEIINIALDNDSEDIRPVNETMETQEQVLETDDNNQDVENKTVVKPKRAARKPLPKLNERTLMGPKGLHALEGYFERVKFKGKGYEEQDLNILMKTYEYWCHRLFPKYPFDTFIGRLEALGTKKAVITNIKKIRMGVANEDEDKPLDSDDELEKMPETNNGFVDEVVDPFDQLLPAGNEVANVKLTEEQLDKIRQNKERAEQIRRERLLKIREKSSSFLPTDSQQSEDMFTTQNNLGQNSTAVDVEISEINVCVVTKDNLPKTNDSQLQNISDINNDKNVDQQIGRAHV